MGLFENRFRLAALCLCFGTLVAAQEFRATVTGHVMDQSGAAIPAVKVDITNQGTNETTSTVSSSTGDYTLPLLTPGTYTLTAQAPGFKKYVRANVALNVGDVAGIDVKMEIGQANESITVSAETPVLQTENADRGLVIDQTRVTELPLNARNPYMLSNLSAGVNFNGNIIYQRPFDNGAIADWSVNGGLDRKNEFLLDGAPNNAQAGANNIALVPPVDSVQEFKVQTNSYDAAYGKSAGGIVNVTTKSGTNKYHGTGYEFMRRNAFDANSFQNNSQGKPKSGHYLDQYGGSVGGPLTVPKVYNGRDKSFFFFNYEGYREATPTPLTLSVPAPEMINGDFSHLTDANGRPITIYNPYSATASANGTVTRQPFAGNVIPASMINPVAQNILKLYPAPNTNTTGSGYSQNNLFVPGGINPDTDRFYNYVFRFDQNFGTNNHVFFRNASNDRTEHRNTNGIMGEGWAGPDPLKRINDAYALDWTSTLSPTLVTDVRASFSRYVEGSRSDLDTGTSPATLGFPQSLVSQLPHPELLGIYTFTNYSTIGMTSNFNYTNTVGFAASLTKVMGAHSIRAGVDLRWIQYNVQNLGNTLAFGATPSWTQAQYNRSDASSGNAIASFLLGLPTTGSVDNLVEPSYLDRYFAQYIQDDWKVARKLTLNLGLRWDFFPGAKERYSQLTDGFDPNTLNPVNAAVQANDPGFPAIYGGLLFVKPGQANQRLDWTGIQPRFGLAYQINDKLVFRGGWGRYMINTTNNNLQSLGYNTTTSLVSSLNNGQTPVSTNLLSNPYPTGLLQPPGSAGGLQTLLGQTISFFDPNFHSPYTDMFSAAFQYQLPLHSRLEVAYVGNRGYKLETSNQYNVIPLALRQQCDPLEGGNGTYCDQLVRNPFYGLAQFANTTLGSSPTISRYQASLPFPQFYANPTATVVSGMYNSITQYGRNDGKLWYNALQLTYSIRAQAGLNLTFAYTRSKAIEQGGYISGLSSGGTDAEEAFTDIQKGVPERSVTAYDRPNSFKISTVYQLPVGRGKAFLSGAPRWVDFLVGGWEHTMIFQYSTGIPWTLPVGVTYVRNAQQPISWNSAVVQGVRPCVAQMSETGVVSLESYSTQVPGCNLTNYNFLYNPLYAPSTEGLRDPSVRLDAKPQFDMSLSKTVHFSESTSFQFRAEAFNVFNTYWMELQQFNNTITSANFGQIIKGTVGTGNSNYPRQIQLGFKFIF